MKSDRYFYSTAAALNLAIMFGGFMPFFLSGHGQNGRIIAPDIFPVVLVHGLGITAWYALSLVQSLLITVRNRRLHMKLGWSSVAVALVVAVSGGMVAIHSARNAGNFSFFGMNYSDFLLVMLTEIAVFTLCVLAALLMRKRPERHRAMMLLASLSLLLGATTRMPLLLVSSAATIAGWRFSGRSLFWPRYSCSCTRSWSAASIDGLPRAMPF